MFIVTKPSHLTFCEITNCFFFEYKWRSHGVYSTDFIESLRNLIKSGYLTEKTNGNEFQYSITPIGKQQFVEYYERNIIDPDLLFGNKAIDRDQAICVVDDSLWKDYIQDLNRLSSDEVIAISCLIYYKNRYPDKNARFSHIKKVKRFLRNKPAILDSAWEVYEKYGFGS